MGNNQGTRGKKGELKCRYCHQYYLDTPTAPRQICPDCRGETDRCQCRLCKTYYDPATSQRRRTCPKCASKPRLKGIHFVKKTISPAIKVQAELSPTQRMSHKERWRRVAVFLARLNGEKLSSSEIQQRANDYAELPKEERHDLLRRAKLAGWVGDTPTPSTKRFFLMYIS